MAITCKLESFKNIKDVVLPLMQMHYEETSFFADKYKFEPNINQYVTLEENDQFKFFTIYNDYELIGYSGYWLYKHQHCDIVIASQDGIYLKKEYRKCGHGKQLIEFIDQVLCAFCVEFVTAAAPIKSELNHLYIKQGYELVDQQFFKRT